MKFHLLFAIFLACGHLLSTTHGRTWAERLGWNKDDRVVIIHVDDAAMSYDSDMGAIGAIEQGMATSTSVMMPCPWVPGFVSYLLTHPSIDAGLHLTLNSEFGDYRWGPVAGIKATPGLVDEQGAFWSHVGDVVKHATADEFETEIRAQIERAHALGFEPTHLDTHMGTVFATPAFMERYIKLGIEYGIPIMFPGGHDTIFSQQVPTKFLKAFVHLVAPLVAKIIWAGGLPVLDDLHNQSYGWKLPDGVPNTDENLRKMKTEKYCAAFHEFKPGVTQVICHATNTTDYFQHISGSGNTRRGDFLSMLDPDLRKCIEDEKLILTTWGELRERRSKVL